ncbi:MAG: hypothetical protein GY941_12685 [Planctomycetes bacterium]|nr:hypothetical protein [Planctomycetota bacterium]
MLQYILKSLLLLSIMLIAINSEASANYDVEGYPMGSDCTVTVPVCRNGSLSEVMWKNDSQPLNREAFLLDQKRGDIYWHGMVDNIVKGTWRNFNNKEARAVIMRLLGDDASQLSDLSIVQVEYYRGISADRKSAELTFKSAKILEKGDGIYRIISRDGKAIRTSGDHKSNKE